MKPGKLYLKIFLSFLLFLVITEIAIFGFFVLLSGRDYRDQHNRYNDSKLKMVKVLIEDKIEKLQAESLANDQTLNTLMVRQSRIFRARIWLTSLNNRLLLKSFKGDVPIHYLKKIEERTARYNKRRFRFSRGWHYDSYLTDTIDRDRKPIAKLHILFLDEFPAHSGVKFAIGLTGIGIIIALLIIPVSRQITRPIKNLTAAALKIEQGNLSVRAIVKSKDEIGELGKAFNRMAEKLERMVISGKELTAQVSHELRSPLTRIQIAVELLKDKWVGTNNPETTDNLNSIQEDVVELDHLIARILELSKLDIQDSVSTSEHFDPVSILEAIIKKFDPMIEGKKISLSTALNSLEKISGNREAFAVALSNIIDNACKFSPTAGSLTVATKSEGELLSITVTNDCPALPQEALTKIFEPFYRTDTRQKTGTGLGLAITKKIVEQHQGEITAKNTPQGLEIKIKIATGASS